MTINTPDAFAEVFVSEGTFFNSGAGATQPWFLAETGAGAEISFLLQDDTQWFSASGKPIVQATSPALSVVVAVGGVVLNTDVTLGAGVTIEYSSDSFVETQGAGVTLDLLSQAQLVEYSPAVPGNWNPTPAQVAAALDQLATRAAQTFVFQPGGVASGNVFTSWASLYAALPAASTKGFRPPTTIKIDDSFTSPAVIPVGTGAYNLDGVTFTAVANSVPGFGGAALNIASGVTITCGVLRFSEGLTVTYLGTAACITSSAATQAVNLYIDENVLLQSTSTGAFLSATHGVCIVVLNNSYMGDGTHTTILSASPAVVQVLQCGASEIDNAACSGTGLTLTWDVIPPFLPQGAGVTIEQYSGAGTFTNPLQGASALPLKLAVGTSFSVAAGATLSAAQQQFPVYVLTGIVPAGGETLILPNVIGSGWYFDLRGVTLTGTLTFSTGSGTTDSVTAANLTATGQHGVIVMVTASHVVTRFS